MARKESLAYRAGTVAEHLVEFIWTSVNAGVLRLRGMLVVVFAVFLMHFRVCKESNKSREPNTTLKITQILTKAILGQSFHWISPFYPKLPGRGGWWAKRRFRSLSR